MAIFKQSYVLGEITHAGCKAFGRDGGAVEEEHAEPPAVDAPRHEPQEVRAGHLWRFGNIASKKTTICMKQHAQQTYSTKKRAIDTKNSKEKN